LNSAKFMYYELRRVMRFYLHEEINIANYNQTI